jgi:putative acetyltransferase
MTIAASAQPSDTATEAGAFTLRPVADADGMAVARLIADCFAEYPGCLYEPSEFPELEAPAAWAASRGTRFTIAEADGALIGCICATPDGAGWMELHKFYVAAAWRGGVVARALFAEVERAAALSHGVLLWTDTRFTRAHRFYERQGFVRQSETRLLHDVSNSEEFHYRRMRIGA